MKKVYSALTLTLLAAVGGAVLAKSFPLLANPFLVLGASLYLIFSLGKFIFIQNIMTVYILAGRQGSNRERLTKLILFGGVTGAGLRPLLNFAIMVNPNLVPTALILTASVFICFSLVSWQHMLAFYTV